MIILRSYLLQHFAQLTENATPEIDGTNKD